MKRILVALALCLPLVHASAETYPMQGGNLVHWNQNLSASGLNLPFQTNWAVNDDTGFATYGGPLVLESEIIINRLAQLCALDRSTGNVLWKYYAPGGAFFSDTPTYDPDRNVIYTSDSTGATYCLSPTGQVLWTHLEPNAPFVDPPSSYLEPIVTAAPLYANGCIYANTAGNGLICMNADTQAVLWRVLPEFQFKTPEIFKPNETGDPGNLV
jgi:outer membrane protein assembly factor BamB